MVTQLSAVSSALDRAGFAVISTAMRYCFDPDSDQDGDAPTIEELEKLFMSLS